MANRSDEIAYQCAQAAFKGGDFTPGAHLTPPQIARVMQFVTCQGKTNEETLANMASFFKAPSSDG